MEIPGHHKPKGKRGIHDTRGNTGKTVYDSEEKPGCNSKIKVEEEYNRYL